MRTRLLALFVMSFVCVGASASTIQLTSPSQLSPGSTVITFPTVTSSTSVLGPLRFPVRGNALTFTDQGDAVLGIPDSFFEETVGVTAGFSAFPDGTNILYAGEYIAPFGPITGTFSNGVTQLGFNAESYIEGPVNLVLVVYQGNDRVGTFFAQGNSPDSLAFLGAQTTDGTLITSFDLFSGYDDVAIGPVSFTTPATTTTPEPSSIALLGTGLLSFIGFVRKRLAWSPA